MLSETAAESLNRISWAAASACFQVCVPVELMLISKWMAVKSAIAHRPFGCVCTRPYAVSIPKYLKLTTLAVFERQRSLSVATSLSGNGVNQVVFPTSA